MLKNMLIGIQPQCDQLLCNLESCSIQLWSQLCNKAFLLAHYLFNFCTCVAMKCFCEKTRNLVHVKKKVVLLIYTLLLNILCVSYFFKF